ncbi:hypothetical protein POTOM_031538 [Populus tomentosa]|uniref:Uncharacterized protein n=1 Tax=Populus tomentosa TaxID=118781 RepID=A0A8X7ZIS1_POPTO|nr:hypothetical protein POTOM_031538 [Populus tomentosa]
MSHNLETRSLMGEIRRFDKRCFFDFGHPLLNRIAESFVKAAGIGAIQAVSREAYFTAIEGAGLESSGGVPPEISVDCYWKWNYKLNSSYSLNNLIQYL